MEADLNRHVDYCWVDFHCRVIFTCVRVYNLRVNKMEAMFERLRVNVNVDSRIAFAFTRDLLYKASFLFTQVTSPRANT